MGLLICNIAPGTKFRQDTLNTLKYNRLFDVVCSLLKYLSSFAVRTKNVENRPVINERGEQSYYVLTSEVEVCQTTVQSPNPTSLPFLFNLRSLNLLLLFFKPSQQLVFTQERRELDVPLFQLAQVIECPLCHLPLVINRSHCPPEDFLRYQTRKMVRPIGQEASMLASPKKK